MMAYCQPAFEMVPLSPAVYLSSVKSPAARLQIAKPAVTREMILDVVANPRKESHSQWLVSTFSSPKSARIRVPTAAGVFFSAGYHEYWNKDYEQALKSLDMALVADDADARVWYFKGFTEQALGRRDDAIDSLSRAVQLHARAGTKRAVIDQSLQRIQGHFRQELHAAVLGVHAATKGRDESKRDDGPVVNHPTPRQLPFLVNRG